MATHISFIKIKSSSLFESNTILVLHICGGLGARGGRGWQNLPSQRYQVDTFKILFHHKFVTTLRTLRFHITTHTRLEGEGFMRPLLSSREGRKWI